MEIAKKELECNDKPDMGIIIKEDAEPERQDSDRIHVYWRSFGDIYWRTFGAQSRATCELIDDRRSFVHQMNGFERAGEVTTEKLPPTSHK